MFVQKFKKVFEFVYFSIVIILAAGAYIACDIGLGGAVDTEPPTGGISSPGDNAVIRDSFAIKGSWKDDGAVGKVTVALRNTSTNSTNTYNATVAPDGTWLCAVNPADSSQPLVDGNYVATVTLYDNGGHTGKLTRSYTVDNTPPVVILQRPSTIITDLDTDTYGQKFTLQGQAADDNNINKIDVNVYSDSSCTNFLKTISLNNVPASINLDVATFSESIDNDYSVIYGHTTKSGSEIRYCKILAYDGAQRYPADGSNQTAADTYGNVQTEYYLYDEISSTVLSNYKVNEIYSMYNGTYATSDSSRALATSNENMEAVKAALAGKAKSTGKFALNPANNPIFTVSGKNQLKKDGKDFTDSEDYFISTGNEVMVEVSTGLDGITLEEASLRVYFLECDNNGKSINDIKYYPVTEKTKSGTGYKFKTPVASGLKSADLTKELILGHTYIFGVEGQDTSGNTVEANGNGYGFYLAASGAAPNLNVTFSTSPDGANWTEQTDSLLYLKKDTWVKIEGSVTVEQGRPDFSIKLDNSDNKTTQDWLGDEKRENPFTYTFKKIYEPSDFGSVSKQHDLVVTATQSRRTTEKAYTILYDLEGPVITLSDISPVAAKYTDELGTSDGKKYLNGNNVSIRFAISDAYDVVDSTNNKAFIQILDKESGAVKLPANGEEPVYITTPANFTWADIDTRKIASGDESKEIIIRVTAYDRAGNKTVTDFSDYFVDQTTDKPVVLPNTPSMLSFGISVTDGISEKNKYSSGTQLLIKLMDDDGLAGITTYCIKENDNSVISEKTDSVTGINATYTYNLPTGVGYYYYRFRVTDIKGNENFVPSESGKFIIRITAGAPTLQDVKAYVKDGDEIITTTEYTKGSQSDDSRYFENKIVFDSEYSYFIIYRSTSETGTYEPVSGDSPVQLTKENGSFVYRDSKKDKTSANKTLRPAETTTFYYKVAGVDIADTSENNKYSSNIKSVTCKVDKSAPKVTLKALPGADDTKVDSYTFRGTSSDEGGSGVEKVFITIKDSLGNEAKRLVSDTANWSYDLKYKDTTTDATATWATVFNAEGPKTIYIEAVDAAGNKSEKFRYPSDSQSTDDDYDNTKLLTFLFDTAAPTLTVNDSVITEYMPNTGFDITGTSHDSYSVEKLTITQKFGDEAPIEGEIILNESNTTQDKDWNVHLPFTVDSAKHINPVTTPQEGKYSYSFVLTDKKGNKDTKTYSTAFDKTPPTILNVKIGSESPLIASSDNSVKKENGSSKTKWYSSQTHTIEVYAEDSVSGIDTVEWCTSSSSGTDENAEWQPLTKKTDSNNKPYYKGTVAFDDSAVELGSKLYIRAVDKADNKQKFYTKKTDASAQGLDHIVFNIDTNKPSLALSLVQIGTNTSKSTTGTEYINGKTTDTLTLYGTYSNRVAGKTVSGVDELRFECTGESTGINKTPSATVTYSTGIPAAGQTAENLTYQNYSAISDKTAITYWKAVFANSAFDKGTAATEIFTTGDLSVIGKSVAGEETGNIKLFTLNKDISDPIIKDVKLITTSTKYKVYQPKADELTFFINNTNTSENPQTFTVFGIAEDDGSDGKVSSGVYEVKLNITALAADKQPSAQKSASFSGLDLKEIPSTGTTATLTVADNAGNTTTETITIKVDTEPPLGIHALDGSENGGKDLYFRIGDTCRDVFVKTNAIGEVVNASGNVIGTNEDAVALTDGTTTEGVTYAGIPSWDPVKDKDVGGKYSGNTFGNAETVKLRGRFDDGTSGSNVNLIYYKIFTKEPSSTETKKFLDSYETEANGYFSPLKTPETRRVFYTGSVTAYEGEKTVAFTPVNGGNVTVTNGTNIETKYYTDITTNYKTTIPNLNPGANFLVFVAVDNVGNAALECIKHNNVEHDNYRINVDTQAPTITSSAPATGLFTNATSDLTISGTVIDNPTSTTLVKAGVKNVWLKYDENKEHWIKADVDETNGTWTASVPETVLEEMSGSKSFTATATDKSGSGNSASCTTTVTIDKTPPTVEITGPVGAGTKDGITVVNGAIKIKGVASDANGLKEPVVNNVTQTPKLSLYYRLKTDADTTTPSSVTSIESWTKYPTEIENNAEWTLYTPPVPDGKTQDLPEGIYYFTIAATDKAENTGYSAPLALNVNKDSDRPVIKFYMTFADTLTSDKDVLDGVISDDDGIPKSAKVWCFIGDDSTSPGDSDWMHADGNTFSYNESTGSFSLKPRDGEKYIWFKIQDEKGQTFVTSASTDYDFNTPIITDKEEATTYGAKPASGTTSTATRMVITIDTTPPESKDIKFTRTPSTDSSWSNAISGEQFGGTRQKFYLQQYAYDANGVKKVYLSLPVNTEDGTSTVITAWSYTDSSTKVKSIVYTNGNKPTTTIKAYSDYASMTGTGASITAVAADFSTITVGGKSYARENYIFPLSKTATIDNSSGVDYFLWQTPFAENNDKPVDVTNLVSGTRTASIISYDGIRSSSNTIAVNIDNTAPVISFSGPSNTSALSGSVTVYGSVDSKADVYYAVSTSGTVSPDSTTVVNKWYDHNDEEKNLPTSLNANTERYTVGTKEYKYYEYKKIDDASLSWFVYFDETVNGDSNEAGEHQLTLNKYLVKYGITDEAKLAATDSSQFNTVVKFYVWIKAIDERGNVSEIPRLVLLDPQGDRPEIKFSYPSENGKTYGGQIQLSGSANDKIGSSAEKIGIESVWMQIIAKQHITGTDSNGKKLYGTGGTFTLDSDKSIATFPITKADLDYLKDKYDIYNMKTYHTEESHTKYSGTIAAGYTAADYAIRITPEGSSWNHSINENGELDFTYVAPENATEEEIKAAVKTNDVAVRVYAQDKDGKISVQKDLYMVFDAQNPVVGSPQALYLIKSDDAHFGTSTTSPNFKASAYKEYSSDMFVRGQWYLIGSVNDNDSIKTLKIHNDTLITYDNKDPLTATAITNGVNYSTWTSTDKKTVYFKYKLSTASGVGALAFNIYVEDQASPNSGKTTKEMSIKYDNTAPVLATAADSSYKLSPNIVQSNGFYRLESKAWEDAVNGNAQSGLDSVAFYFMRRNTIGTETDTIYNPMLSSSNSVTVNASTPLMDSTEDTSTTTVVYDSGLYWKKEAVTRSSTLNQLGIASTGNNMYIRKGGLVKVGGSIYKIIERTDSTLTLSGNPPQNETTAYFAIALISDHTSPENGSTTRNSQGYPATITGDDGDGMVDYVEKYGTSYTWSAEIVSKNIPDGPIEIHYVVFDAAGNYSIGIVGNKAESDYRTSTSLVNTKDRAEYAALYSDTNRTSNILYVDGTNNVYNTSSTSAIANELYKKAAFVANNAPRLAAVKIWTDYNGDNQEQDDEQTTKYCNQLKDVNGNYINYAGGVTRTFVVSSNGKDYLPAEGETETGTAIMVIRDKTTFTPEIVGGNGILNYKGRVAKAANLATTDFSGLSENWIAGTKVQVEESDYLKSGTTYVDLTNTRHGDIVFGATAADWTALGTNSSSDSDPYWFEYQIWDSTDGTTPGTNSLYATMRIALNVDYFDLTKPWAKISPFYWESKNKNSVAWTGSGSNLKANGHIELERDITQEIKTALGETASNEVVDPKVSGEIKIEGSAFDNIRLKALYAQFTDHSGFTKYQLLGSYDGTWDNKSGTGWIASIEDVSVNSSGHSVKWTLTVDTAYVGVGKNKAVTVFAVDARGTATNETIISGTTITGNTSVSDITGAAQTTKDTETPYYQMDVVPYISDVETSLSSLKRNNPSVFARTALGHYPVRYDSSETIKIKGFNLSTSGAKELILHGNEMSTGEYNLVVGSIPVLNNKNGNDKSGSYTSTVNLTENPTGDYSIYQNYYNRQPNGDNNNLLTDDVFFDVWEFDSDAVIPISGKIEQPHMAINPKTGALGFAFVNGPLYFSMAGSTQGGVETSYDYWMGSYDFFTSVGFTYDSLGNSFGLAAGGDINASEADKFQLMSYRFGGKAGTGQSGSYSSINSLRLESIGMKGTKHNTSDNTNYFDKQRIKSPSLVSSVHGNDTNLYLAYYDAMNDEIRFKAGSTSNYKYDYDDRVAYISRVERVDYNNGWAGVWISKDDKNGKEIPLTNIDYFYICDANGNVTDDTKYYIGGIWDGRKGDLGLNAFTSYRDSSKTDRCVPPAGITQSIIDNSEEITDTQTFKILSDTDNIYYKLVDDKDPVYRFDSFYDYDRNRGVYRYRNEKVSLIAGDGTDYGAGSYVSLGVIPGTNSTDDVVVAVWYDEGARVLRYSYNTTPLTDRNGTTDRSGWSKPKQIFTGDMENAGEYCQIAVDQNDGIHIAAYDSVNCDLVYAFLPTYTSDPQTCVVDANGVVGSNITIDVALNNATDKKAIPRIGYYATSCIRPKMAYLVETSDIAANGSEDDRFTGKWECSVVPTAKTVSLQSNQYNKMNIAVWKNDSGVITSCADNKFTEKAKTNTNNTTSNNPNGYNSTSYGFVYGNGTKNAVMGYAIKVNSSSDAIETAQMR